MTVKDLLTFGGLATATVVAGLESLNAPVTGITVLEVAESQISRWVQQNEVYITSFYAISDNAAMQKVVIGALHKSGCSALVLCHLGQVLQELDEEVVSLCNDLAFPLIVADPQVTYSEIIRPVIQCMSKADEEESRKTLPLRLDVSELLISEADPYEILKRLSVMYAIEVTFIDSSLQCAYSNKYEAVRDEELAFVGEAYSRPEAAAPGDGFAALESGFVYMKEVRNKGDFLGMIILGRDSSGKPAAPGPREERTLERVAEELFVPCGIAFGRLRRNVEDRVADKYEYIRDLLIGNFPSTDAAIARGTALGYAIRNKKYILVININAIHTTEDGRPISNHIRTWFMPGVSHLLRRYGEDNFAALQSDTIVCFLDDPGQGTDIGELGEKALQLFSPYAMTSVSVGYDRAFASPGEIAEAYTRSFLAAVIGREVFGENRHCSYDSIRMMHMLKKLQGDKEAAAACESLFAKLAAYDREHNGALAQTLRVLLSSGLNTAEAAEKLFIHRNTLQYRKKKIEEILGYNPLAMPHLLNVGMAAYVWR